MLTFMMRLWYIAWLRHLPSSVINYGNETSFVLRRSTWSPMLSVSICYVNVKISENDRIKNNINCCWCNQQLLRTEPSTPFYMETASAQSILISYSKIWLLNCELATSRNLTEWIEHCHSDPPEVARWSPDIYILVSWSPCCFWPVTFVPCGTVT